MTPEQKIQRLEQTLGTLIAWLARELGDSSTQKLLEMLEKETK